MNVIDTKLKEVKIIEPSIFNDERGYFFESFNSKRFNQAIGKDINFVQDNHSFSTKNTLRGIHYQLPPHAQGKLVRVLEGEVYDVAVDLRKSSDSFGAWTGAILSGENKKQFWVPEGFGHGFVVLSESAHFLYKTTNYYNKESEGSIIWNDKELEIDWKTDNPILSDKDAAANELQEAKLFE